MYGIELICSDEACAELVEIAIPTLSEIELLACDGCGCTLQALAVSDVVEIHVAPPMALPLAA
ncbi:MAG TPA: hypothetical protein VEX36_09195 [Thermoleophilaceae bacterium]|nr:hypothetical protein [Thermoleophilaceae bacterium]